MEVKRVIDDHVRRRLEDTFGKAVAMMIFASATREADVPIIDPTTDDFMRLVDALCCDQRVVDMWGRAGAEDAARDWRSMVR